MSEFDRSVVVTSILPPTRAVSRFVEILGWPVIVVGDQGSPADWSHAGCLYLSPRDQKACTFRITKYLPWNHYSRKMIGYLYALGRGARVILDSDDDNILYQGWQAPEFKGRFRVATGKLGFINIYKLFTDQHIWPRGFPLRLVTDPGSEIAEAATVAREVQVGIWQGLVDGEPDVDAIYRLTVNQPITFRQDEAIVLSHGTICTFNSQNTLFSAPVFPLLYLPGFVSFRFTDILRSLVAQPIMWLRGIHVGFSSATACQERNSHDLLKDFESEIPCYLHAEEVVERVQAGIRSGYSIQENLYQAYEKLLQGGIVVDKEMDLLGAWIRDSEATTT
jgi:hypothetical protein